MTILLPEIHNTVFPTKPTTEASPDISQRFLVVSPYTAPAHLLDLTTVDKPQQLMAKALVSLRALTPSYAVTPYAEAFNWGEVVAQLTPLSSEGDGEGEESYIFPETSFYIIVFRSQIAPTTSGLHLGELDAEAHREATQSGGLLKYWFGTPDQNGRNMATCVWRHRDDAKRGGAGPVGSR